MILNPDLVERVDAVFDDMDKPGHPGAGLLVIDRRVCLPPVLRPRRSGNSAADHGGHFVLSGLDLQAVRRHREHAAG
jgi:hypothetical protein